MTRALAAAIAVFTLPCLAEEPSATQATVKRDPFQAPTIARPTPGEPAPCRGASCLLDEDSLQVVAVVSGTSNPSAMVEDRGGRGFVLRKNSPIGANGARVEKITAECVHVSRFTQALDGRAVKQTTPYCVPPPRGAGGDLDYTSGTLR